MALPIAPCSDPHRVAPEAGSTQRESDPAPAQNRPLHEQGKPIKHLYFPNSGVISLVTDVSDGQPVETGTIGREGVAGISAFLGMRNATGRAFCQIPGDGVRITCEALQAEVDRGGSLGPILLRYTNALMAMLAQGAACTRSHALEQRMCRWLLMTRDRVDSDDFPLTQEFLAQMLAVRRPSVSVVGATLQAQALSSTAAGGSRFSIDLAWRKDPANASRSSRISSRKP